VIDEIDEALRAFLQPALPERTVIGFEPPTSEWSARVDGPTLNLFLGEVRENGEGRTGDWDDVRDDQGRVLGRRPPVRRFDLAYHVSAWGGTAVEQHSLLGAVLAALPVYDSIPAEHLSKTLQDYDLPVRLRVADAGAGAGADVWQSLGQPVRASFTLIVTASLVPATDTDLAPPASSIDLGLAATRGRAGRSPVPTLPEPAGSSSPRKRPDGDDRGWTAFRTREHIAPGER
jgi:Pvc16 N-terminal domain